MHVPPVRTLGRLLAALACAVLETPAPAQFGPPDLLRVSVKAPATVAPGKIVQLQVVLNVKQSYHVQADTVKPPYIPAKVTVTAPKGFRVAAPAYPRGKMTKVGSDTLAVFEGAAVVRVPVTVPATATGAQKLTVKVSYQACDATSCFPPSDATATITLKIAASKTPAKRSAATPAAGSAGLVTEAPAPAGGLPPGYQMTKISGFVPADKFIAFLQAGSGSPGGMPGGDALTKLLTANLALALPIVFVVGLALNLTPCVYPIIPITISYFGGQASQSGRKPLVLALFYVLGMAVMYSVLGVVAGLSRGVFGAQLQNPWVLGFFALVMFALALSQFDRPDGRPIWEFQLPAALRNQSGPRSGIAGAVVMGLLVGVVAAPCVGPAVVALLQWVATQGNPFLGFLVFFTLSLGLGAPYVALASVSGSVKRLPRSGEWMVGVKHVFGVVMICMGFYYLQAIIDTIGPHAGTRTLIAVIALSGLWLLFVDKAGMQARFFRLFKRGLGIAAIAGAVALAVPAPAEKIRWQPLTDTSLTAAAADRKVVVIDFTAAWCAQCKELERYTFSDEKVGAAARDIVALRGDMTDTKSPAAQDWTRRYGITGLPTVVRLAPSG